MVKKIKFGKKVTALIIVGLVFFIIAGLHLLGVFNFLEYKSYDMMVQYWADKNDFEEYKPISLIFLDQDSIDWAQQERGWGWPWPRQAYAEMVEYINFGGAKSIAFDVIFSEPSIYRNAKQDEIIERAVQALEEAEGTFGDSPERLERQARTDSSGRSMVRIAIDALRSLKNRVDDASFVKASVDFGKVIQTVMFSSQTGSYLSWPAGLNAPIFQTENFGDMLNVYSIGEDEKGIFPIEDLRNAAGALGCVTGIPDSDGVIRRLRPFTVFDGKAVPGLSLASLIVDGVEVKITYNNKNGTIELGRKSINSKTGEIELVKKYSIPVNKEGYALLRYKGDLQKIYRPLRAMDVLRSAELYNRQMNYYAELKDGEDDLFNETEDGVLLNQLYEADRFIFPGYFEDKFIFVGYNAQGLFDIFSTPISSVYSGVGCHVTMLDNLLYGEFIRESSDNINLIILLVVVAAIVCLTMFSNRIYLSIGGTVIFIIGIIIGAFAAYQFGGLWIPMVTYLAGTLVSFVTVTFYNYATEGNQKRFIKSAFSQYLSPKVVDQLILDPSQLKLGGEKREMTAIFTDIRAFSTFSEALGDPAKLVELLNFYLTRMSNIVLDNQGTIDKYEGDAIIAFFGAPIHFDNHAALACRATIKMKKAEADINREALSLGLITPDVMSAMVRKGVIGSIDDPYPIFTRLGVNTGDMVVGNMGTPNKMDYTIMGNAVNLAARLEGVNKQYDTGGILISEYTRDHICGQGSTEEFVLRPLSKVRVVGINTPLRLYELLDIASEAKPELIQMVKDWEKAFDLYEKREFKAAQGIFQDIFNKNNGDLTAKKYLERCVKNLSSPPDDKIWDNGVDNLTEK